MSIAVLVLLLVLLSKLVNGAAGVVTNSRKRLDPDSHARMIFDRMATDVDQMVKRKDVDYIFYKNTGPSVVNDAMFFYSKAPAYYNTNPAPSDAAKGAVRLIGYRINSSLQLERLGKGLTWDGAAPNPGGAMFLTYSSPTSNPSSTISGSWVSGTWVSGNWAAIVGTPANNYADGVDGAYNVISDQAYRMEIAFVLNDGTVSTKPVVTAQPATWPSTPNPAPAYYTASTSDPASTNDSDQTHPTVYTVGSRWLNTSSNQAFICASAIPGVAIWSRIGIQDVSAIVVAIALLDPTSQKIVTNRASMVGALADPTDADLQAAPPRLMAQTWLNAVTSQNFASTSGIPSAAASQVRVYQRYFYLNR